MACLVRWYLPEFRQVRTKIVVEEYDRRKLLGKGGALRVSAATNEGLAKMLREVLEAEQTAVATEKAHAEARRLTEAQASRRARKARKGRGTNRYHPSLMN